MTNHWTRERPTVPGWYWFRNDKDKRLEVVVLNINSIDDKLYSTGLDKRGLFSQGRVDNFHGDWAGPLEQPT